MATSPFALATVGLDQILARIEVHDGQALVYCGERGDEHPAVVTEGQTFRLQLKNVSGLKPWIAEGVWEWVEREG